MNPFGDEPVRKPKRHELGQDLSLLSVDELKLRIADLEEEIARIQGELRSKTTTMSAAEALFARR